MNVHVIEIFAGSSHVISLFKQISWPKSPKPALVGEGTTDVQTMIL